jgi:hypothetical protein
MTWGVNLRGAYGETGTEFPAKKKSTDGLDGIIFSFSCFFTERQVTQFLYSTCLMLYLF